MSDLTPRQAFFQIIDYARKYFHSSPVDGEVEGRRFPINLFLMGLSYLLDKKHLLVGEPGFGKTTSAKVLAALFSGLPYDLYDAAQIEGNPEKTEEKMVARPDYGALHQGVEEVVWQLSHHLPVLVVDEFARLPPAKQEILLQGIETGRWSYLNASIYQGRKPAFITMNHPEDVNSQIIPPMLDRFHVTTEEGWHSSFALFDIDKMRQWKKALEEPDLTQQVTEAITAKEEVKGMLKGVKQEYQKRLQEKGVPFLRAGYRKSLTDMIMKQQVAEDSMLFLQCLDAELNFSRQSGRKRSNEPVSEHSHDTNYIGVHVKNATSPRAMIEGILDYSKGLSYLLKEREGKVTIEMIRFVAPYVLAHRLQFTDDYRNEYRNKERKEMMNLFLAKKLVEEGFEHYQVSIDPIKETLVAIRDGNQEEIKKFREKGFYDHPLQWDTVEQLKQRDPYYPRR